MRSLTCENLPQDKAPQVYSLGRLFCDRGSALTVGVKMGKRWAPFLCSCSTFRIVLS